MGRSTGKWAGGRHAVAQAATQAARSFVHWAKREKRETTPRRGQPHRAERKTKQKGPNVGRTKPSHSQIAPEREGGFANPTTTAESRMEARPGKPHSAGRRPAKPP